MSIPYEDWTVVELTDFARRLGVSFSLDPQGKLQVTGVSTSTPAALVRQVTQRWDAIEQYLAEEPQP